MPQSIMGSVTIRSVLLLSLTSLSCYYFFNASSSIAEVNPPPPPVCRGSGAPPAILGDTLRFCRHGGLSCCDAVEDAVLIQEFKAMNISDAECATAVQAMLCERCDPSRPPEVFQPADPVTTMRSLPDLLCTALPSSSSSSARHLQQGTTSMCIKKIAADSYLTMAAHPDGSGRAFFSTLDGKIWLASILAQGHRGTLRVVGDGAGPFLDLSDRVHQLKGVAFHPGFATNGRFFVSYSSASPTGGGIGRCFTSAAGGNGFRRSCRYQLVVAEFSAQGGGADYSKATRANPAEVKRIFTVGLPQLYTSYSYQHHGGQILFQPNDSDGHLYLITGYGANDAHGQLDPSMHKRSFLGKIIRLYVDCDPPKTEIYAMSLSNPSGCSFDSERPSDMYCADVDQHQYEKVYLMVSNKFRRNKTTGSSAKTVIGHGRPAFGRMPSIVGGIVYRGSEDPSLKGRYLYMYASAAWVAVGSTGLYVSDRIPSIRCSGCRGGIGGHVLSFGEDSSKNAFVLTTDGVYQLVQRGLCGAPPLPPAQAPGTVWLLCFGIFALASAVFQVYMAMFSPGGETTTRIRECCCGEITCLCCSSCFARNYYGPRADQHEA